MATKTSPSRRSSSRSSAPRPPPAGRPGNQRRSAPRAGSRGPRRRRSRQILSPHARDAIGIGLVVLALLAVLGCGSTRPGRWGAGSRGPDGRVRGRRRTSSRSWASTGALLLRDTAREDAGADVHRVHGVHARACSGSCRCSAGTRRAHRRLRGSSRPPAGSSARSPRIRCRRVIACSAPAIVCAGARRPRAAGLHRDARSSTAWRRLRDFFTAADVEEDEEEAPSPSRPADRVRRAGAKPKVSRCAGCARPSAWSTTRTPTWCCPRRRPRGDGDQRVPDDPRRT